VRAKKGVRLYGAGVSVDENGIHRAKGGRLFYAVGEGHDVDNAAQKAYDAMGTIFVDGDPAGGNNLHYRRDIGWRDVQRLRERK
jgi:phosphoribosylamine-glycine ligase